MSFPYKKLLLKIFFIAHAQAHEAVPAPTQKNFFSEFWSVFTSKFDGGKTQPIFEKIGLEAQAAVGITTPWPVKKLHTNHYLAPYAAYLTTEDTIYVNEALMGPQSFGIANALMHHEAIHVKNKDARTLRWVPVTSGLIGALATYMTLKAMNIKKAQWLSVWAAWVIISNLSKKIASQFIEAHADREGFKATQCTHCLQEMALNREVMEVMQKFNLIIFLQGGYVSAPEIAQMAKEYEGKVCSYHADPKNKELSETVIAQLTLHLNNIKATRQTVAQPQTA